MTIQMYTEEQISTLLSNPYVASCSQKHITFTPECKKEAVQLYREGMSPRKIFDSFSLPDFLINATFPKDTLKRWRKMIQKDGIAGLGEKKRGPKKKVKKEEGESKTPEEDILYLRAQVAYLKQENDFLRLLRAQRNR